LSIEQGNHNDIAAGEMLSVAGPFIEQQMHPTVIIGAFRQALDDLLTILKDQVSIAVDITNRDEMTRIIKSCIGTKFITKWSVNYTIFSSMILIHFCRLWNYSYICPVLLQISSFIFKLKTSWE